MYKKLFILALVAPVLFGLGTAYTSAQSGGTGVNTGEGTGFNVVFENPFRGGGDLYQLVTNIINNIIMPIGGILAVLAFIWSGFLYVMAQGNQTAIAKAHKAFLYSAVGTAILLGSWALANGIEATIRQLSQ